MGEVFAELAIALAAWMAKMERLKISERTKAGLARAKEGRVGGRRPKVFSRATAQFSGRCRWRGRSASRIVDGATRRSNRAVWGLAANVYSDLAAQVGI
jgi:DNA invertase Pin-like site-specific DNA recombinase